MVSYGFDTIEDFYAKSSTRDVINKVKVPALFIQVLFPCFDTIKDFYTDFSNKVRVPVLLLGKLYF